MEKKIVGILVCTLMIIAAVLPVAGTMNKNEVKNSGGQLSQLDVVVDEDEETSCELADTSATHNLQVPQFKFNDNEMLLREHINAMESCAMWTPQFMYDVGGISHSLYLVGVGFDGNYFYCPEFSNPTIYRFTKLGAYFDSFTIPGVPNLIDLAYDGTYFYGASQSNPNTIHIMSFNPPSYIGQITAPDVAWNIAYDANADSGNGGFWIGQWEYHLTLIDRLGTPIRSITPPESMLGFAWDDVCSIAGYTGPFLWIFTGTSTGAGCIIKCIDLATDTLIPGLEHDVAAEFGQGIAGGLEFTTEWDVAGGTATLFGIVQGGGPPDDYLFGYEMCPIINNPPIANPDTYSVCYDSTNTFNVLVNDVDPDGYPISISSVTTPTMGGTAVPNSTNTGIIYTPAAGFTGTETFTYQITDGALFSNWATVTVDVCCIEIVDIRMHPWLPNRLQVEIKNHCGMGLFFSNRVQLTWEFTIDPLTPCCGDPAYLTEPSGPGPLVYVTTNLLPGCFNGASQTRSCLVKGNACFTLKLTAFVPPTGCSCDKIVTGCVGKLQLC